MIFFLTSECSHDPCRQVAQEMIWVWGEAGPDAVLESALAPLPLDVPELDDTEARKDGRVFAFPPSQIDMPYGWDTVMENHMVRISWLCMFLFVRGRVPLSEQRLTSVGVRC